ncbi:hypothetical protein HDZ31DRAFT_75552 [Schizophyllum fasciatum]
MQGPVPPQQTTQAQALTRTQVAATRELLGTPSDRADPGASWNLPSSADGHFDRYGSPIPHRSPPRSPVHAMDVDAPGTSARHALQASAPIPAPPPLPASLAVDPATEMAEREAWGIRIKAIADALAKYKELQRLKEDRLALRAAVGASPSEARAAQLRRQDARLQQLDAEHRALIARIPGGAWPGAPPPPPADAERTYEAMYSYIKELHATTGAMHARLRAVQAHQAAAGAGAGEEGEGEIDPSGRPRKRARLDERAQAAEDEKAREVDELRERTAQMESKLADLRTLLQQRVDEVRGRVEETLEDKQGKILEVFEEQLKLSADGLPEDASYKDESLTFGQRHALLHQELDSMDSDVQSIGGYIAQVKEILDEQAREISSLQSEVEESRRQAALVNEKLSAYEKQQAANQERLASLTAKLEQHMARHNIPSPQRTPSPRPELITTHDAALAALQEPIAQAVRRELIPPMKEMRRDIQNVIDTQKADILAATWPRMKELLDVLNAVDRSLP